MIKMRKFNLALTIILGAALMSGCTLNKMLKLSSQQDVKIEPNPLELKGGEVPFTISAVLPPKMLPSGKVYTIKTFYQYGDREVEVGEIEFKAEDFPNSSSSTSRKSQDISFEYVDGMNPGTLRAQGIALDPRNGKTRETPKLTLGTGIVMTSTFAKDAYLASYADHGYNNQVEYEPVSINFYFEQGRSVLRPSLTIEGSSNRAKQDNLSAFIAEKNVTKTVTITGTHSPEGPERINSNLSQERAQRIEDYYRAQMDKYDYMDMADSIEFILKPVVEDWSGFKAALRNYDEISDESKEMMFRIVDGNGTFEDKEKQLRKVDGYDKVFEDIYPPLRSAKTEILKVKEKKTAAEISVLAKQVVEGTVDQDTLSSEELLYAATLTPSLEEKRGIYLAATKVEGSWVAHNNLAAVHLDLARQGADNRDQLVEDALTQLEIAANKNENSPEIIANMASAYMMQGDAQKAYDVIADAEDNASNELMGDINAMKGAIEIQMGNYEDAKASLAAASESDVVTFNKGLVNLLTNEYSEAEEELDKITDGDLAAEAYYLKAVVGARQGRRSKVTDNLKEAVAKDSDLKDRALGDLEFTKYADAVAQSVR
jgi:tetratricopeptide (TPR) repeat protein